MNREDLLKRLRSVCSNSNEDVVWQKLSTQELMSIVMVLDDGGFAEINNMYEMEGQKRPCFTLERIVDYISANSDCPVHPVTNDEISSSVLKDILEAYLLWLRRVCGLGSRDIGLRLFGDVMASTVRAAGIRRRLRRHTPVTARRLLNSNYDDDDDDDDADEVADVQVAIQLDARRLLNTTWGALAFQILVQMLITEEDENAQKAETNDDDNSCNVM